MTAPEPSDANGRPMDPGQRYLAFISYRRRDASGVAGWLRERVGGFDAPRDLQAKVAAADARVGGRANRIFLDRSYQRSHADFWDDHIAPSARRSDNLLLLLTPSVFEKLPDGSPNWVEREIDTFLDAGKDPDRILLVLGPGAPDDRVPDRLQKLSARWDWADLRFFSPSIYQRWRHRIDYDAQLTKILARIFDIADGELPALNREFERARARVHRRIYVAGALTIAGLAGLSAIAFEQRQRAVAAERVAIEQRDEAVRQRNAALVAQSLHLTSLADYYQKQGATRTALRLLRAALPNKDDGFLRPLVPETVVAAYNTLDDDHEIGVIPLPADATAAALSPDGTLIAAVSGAAVQVLGNPSGKLVRTIDNPLKSAKSALFSGDSAFLALLADAGGAIVLDVASGATVASLADLGVAARLGFAGRRLVSQTGDGQRLQITDLASGVTTVRWFAAARPFFVSDDGAILLVVADGALRSLSLETLADLAKFAVPATGQIALAKLPGAGDVLIGMGDGATKGELASLDPATLAEHRRYSLTLGTIAHLAVSADGKTVAIHTPPNLAYLDLQTGRSLAGTQIGNGMSRGRFVASGDGAIQNYAAFGAAGLTQVDLPGNDVNTSFRSRDNQTILDVAFDADGRAFTSISARPLATRWLVKESAARATSGQSTTTINGVVFPNRVLRSALSHSGKDAAIVYINGRISVWSPSTGESRIVAPGLAGAFDPDTTTLAWSRDDQLIAIGRKSGEIAVLDATTGVRRMVKVFDAPLASLDFAADGSLIAGAGAGQIARVTIAADALSAQAEDYGSVCLSPQATGATLICFDADNAIAAYDLASRKLLWRQGGPAMTKGGVASDVSESSGRIAIVDAKGLLTVRSVADGAVLTTRQLSTTLSGALARAAVNSPLVDASARAAILGGAETVEVQILANWVRMSPDGKRVAVVFPNHALAIVDVDSGAITPIANSEDLAHIGDGFNSNFLGGAFSTNGKQFAAYIGLGYIVYDFSLGQIVLKHASDLFDGDSGFAALPEGRGFVASSRQNLFSVPVFEQGEDLVAAITRRYPEPLTAKERLFYHAE